MSQMRMRGAGGRFGRASSAARRAFACLVLTGLGTACFAAPNIPCGTYLLKGSVRDVRNRVISAETGLKVHIVNAKGDVLAEGSVSGASPEGNNFAVRVPVSTVASRRTAAVGDSVSCVFVQEDAASGGAVAVAEQPIRVAGANAVETRRFTLVDMVTLTKEGGGESVQIPKTYLESIQPILDGMNRGAYNAWGDYDEDGVSNYREYLAGTNPLDPTDSPKIRGFRVCADGVAEIKFESVGGHVYAFPATTSLTKPEWIAAKVRDQNGGAEQNSVVSEAAEDDSDETTVYVVPVQGDAARFFTLEAK